MITENEEHEPLMEIIIFDKENEPERDKKKKRTGIKEYSNDGGKEEQKDKVQSRNEISGSKEA